MMEIRIQFDEKTGKVALTGPIDQRLVCYGMLDMAREILMKRALTPQPKSAILVPDVRVDLNGKG